MQRATRTRTPTDAHASPSADTVHEPDDRMRDVQLYSRVFARHRASRRVSELRVRVAVVLRAPCEPRSPTPGPSRAEAAHADKLPGASEDLDGGRNVVADGGRVDALGLRRRLHLRLELLLVGRREGVRAEAGVNAGLLQVLGLVDGLHQLVLEAARLQALQASVGRDTGLAQLSNLTGKRRSVLGVLGLEGLQASVGR